MKIKEFAETLRITEYTLRYYEKIGVIRPVRRLKNGFREYDDSDLSWMEFVLRLKDTGMAINKIIEYANLRSIGDSTRNRRRKLLEQHEEILKERIENQKTNLRKIQDKIEYYKKM